MLETSSLTSPALPPNPRRLKLFVGIPSAGRREILAATLRQIENQSRAPDGILVCVPSLEDFDQADAASLTYPVTMLLSKRGLCRQRNTILASATEADIVLFLDDDFLMSPSYLEETEKLFVQYPAIDICTGTVIADGITGPGIPVAEGVHCLQTEQHKITKDDAAIRAVYNGYGCNMAVRMCAVRIGSLRFDENLPLYGWLEDVDFSRLVAKNGEVVISQKLRGVHLGTKVGRTSGLRFGYSQISNPLYLVKKQTMSGRHAALQIGRNLLANVVKVWRPEPWIDRKGRLKGNFLAVLDLVTGRLNPKNIERME